MATHTYAYTHLKNEEGQPYAVALRSQPDVRLGFVWRQSGDKWEAIDGATGQRAQGFSTRTQAAEWLHGKWSVAEGPAAKFIPEDPYEGLPGA